MRPLPARLRPQRLGLRVGVPAVVSQSVHQSEPRDLQCKLVAARELRGVSPGFPWGQCQADCDDTPDAVCAASHRAPCLATPHACGAPDSGYQVLADGSVHAICPPSILCETVLRLPCAEVPFTCGECLPGTTGPLSANTACETPSSTVFTIIVLAVKHTLHARENGGGGGGGEV
jgi:hypothetical protein